MTILFVFYIIIYTFVLCKDFVFDDVIFMLMHNRVVFLSDVSSKGVSPYVFIKGDIPVGLRWVYLFAQFFAVTRYLGFNSRF